MTAGTPIDIVKVLKTYWPDGFKSAGRRHALLEIIEVFKGQVHIGCGAIATSEGSRWLNHPGPWSTVIASSRPHVKMLDGSSPISSIFTTARTRFFDISFISLIQQVRRGGASTQGPDRCRHGVGGVHSTTATRPQGRHYTQDLSLLQQSCHHGSISRSFGKQKPSRYPYRLDYPVMGSSVGKIAGISIRVMAIIDPALFFLSCHRWPQRHPRCAPHSRFDRVRNDVTRSRREGIPGAL